MLGRRSRLLSLAARLSLDAEEDTDGLLDDFGVPTPAPGPMALLALGGYREVDGLLTEPLVSATRPPTEPELLGDLGAPGPTLLALGGYREADGLLAEPRASATRPPAELDLLVGGGNMAFFEGAEA